MKKSSGVFWLSFLIAGTLSCLYKNQYLRNYDLGNTYSASVSETILEYRLAKTRTLESGIPHIIKIREWIVVTFQGEEGGRLRFNRVEKFAEDEYSGRVFPLDTELKPVPFRAKVAAYELEFLRAGKKEITFRIIGEPESMGSGSGAKKEGGKKSGLAF